MKTLRSWNDLAPYGIDVLTGEACAYNYRLLCDMTPAGMSLFRAVFGLHEIALPEGWNNNEARSIMLPRDMFEPLAVFALLTVEHCTKVYVTYMGLVHGVEQTDSAEDVAQFVRWNQGTFCEECQRYGKGGGIDRQYVNPGYSRNTHAMSGRTE
jgi:hypothetical protein